MKTVCISGGFDPFHEGHLDYVKEASKLGDCLIVAVNCDQDMINKKGKCNLPLWFRMKTVGLWMKEYEIEGKVIASIDSDGSQAKTIRMAKPDIFANGGDRTLETANVSEIEACKEVGCRDVYGVGSEVILKANSSSSMVFSNAK